MVNEDLTNLKTFQVK